MAETFYPFVENGGFSPGGDDVARPTTPARIAVYDDMAMTPRVVMVEPSDIRTFLDEITAKVYELASARCDEWSFMLIRELVENLIHASFSEPVISILDKGKTISFSDQGPGIPNKTAALKPSFSSATAGMKRYIRGVGSGLPIVERQLELQHGTITIEDNLGCGTTVTVSFAHKDEKSDEDGPQQTAYVVDSRPMWYPQPQPTYPGGTPQGFPGAYGQFGQAGQYGQAGAYGQQYNPYDQQNNQYGQQAGQYGSPAPQGNPYGQAQAYGQQPGGNPYGQAYGQFGQYGQYAQQPGQTVPNNPYEQGEQSGRGAQPGSYGTYNQYGQFNPYGQPNAYAQPGQYGQPDPYRAYGQQPSAQGYPAYGQGAVPGRSGAPVASPQPSPAAAGYAAPLPTDARGTSQPGAVPPSATEPSVPRTPEAHISGIDAHVPLTSDQRDVILLFRKCEKIGPKELGEHLSVPAATGSRRLKEIAVAGLIVKKGQKYVLTGEGQRMFSYLNGEGA